MDISLSGVRPVLARDRKIAFFKNFSPECRDIQGESAQGLTAKSPLDIIYDLPLGCFHYNKKGDGFARPLTIWKNY
jgi:hypothetical protein